MLPNKPVSHFFYIRSVSGTILVPDTLPTATLIRGIIDTTVPVTVAAAVDGGYHATMLIPADWIEGDIVSLRIAAIKDGQALSQTTRVGMIINMKTIRSSLTNILGAASS